MKKILSSLLLLVVLQSFAQSTKQISIAPLPRVATTATKSIVPLNESGLIPIQQGNTFKIVPNVSFAPRKHYFLKGVLKSAGAFVLTYQASRVINTGKDVTTAKSSNILPATGVGLAAGLPEMIKGLKKNKTYLNYSLYNNNKELIKTENVLLTRKTAGNIIQGNAAVDGFLKVAVIGNIKLIIPNDVIVDLIEPAPLQYSGGIANNMNLDAGGDCAGSSGGGGGTMSEDDKCKCGETYNKEIAIVEKNYKLIVANCNKMTDKKKKDGCNETADTDYLKYQTKLIDAATECIDKCKK